MANINFSIEGLESIQEEYDKSIVPKLNKPIKAGLKALDSDMRSMLKFYIEIYVYDAYKPDSYERRAEHPEYGTSISDMDGNVDSLILNNALRFAYVPNGRHTEYDEEDGVLNGDDLIRTIETGKGYSWVPDGYFNKSGQTLGERAFWTNFCTQLFDGNSAEHSFINGFNANSGDIGRLTPENNIELTSSDDYTFKY